MRRWLRGLSVGFLLVSVLPPATVLAAEYQLATVADYVVDPAAGQITVTVGATFTNTTPDPPGKLSAFDRIDIAVHAGASRVEATDAIGPLAVDLLTRDGVQIASLKTRARVRYNRSVTFTLTYGLADGVAPGVHVRPEVVKFAAFGFGTSSEVSVELPAGYEARADGDPMVTAPDAAGLRLTSGPIPDPDRWLALITASGPGTFLTQTASVPLDSGTVDLQVRAWSGDPAWGIRTLALLVAGLPALEQAIGLPYPRVGPLVVTEASGGEGSAVGPPAPSAEVQAAFDGDDFTLLHQAAHLWISSQLAADRWIREGLASHYAERAARHLNVALPYDPSARAETLVADASPLAGWGDGDPGGKGDAYAYAASWSFVDRLAAAAGEDHVREALARVAAGLSAYEPTDPEGNAPAGGFLPVDSRRLLDQLETAGGVDLTDLFAQTVFAPEMASVLAQRGSARAHLANLLVAAGDWGAPEAVRSEMGAWRFDRARDLIGEAAAWLLKRDALVEQIATGGLATPDRLREAYITAGGGVTARQELDAEQAVVAPFLELRGRVMAPRGPLEAIGLFAMDDPGALLADAAASFGAGDLRTAASALDHVELELNRAPTNGIVRIASAIVLLGVIGLLASRTARHRGGSHYTARP